MADEASSAAAQGQALGQSQSPRSHDAPPVPPRPPSNPAPSANPPHESHPPPLPGAFLTTSLLPSSTAHADSRLLRGLIPQSQPQSQPPGVQPPPPLLPSLLHTNDDDDTAPLQLPPAPQPRPTPAPIDPDSGTPTPSSPPIIGALPPAVVASIAEELASAPPPPVPGLAAGQEAVWEDRDQADLANGEAEAGSYAGQGKTYTAIVTPATTSIGLGTAEVVVSSGAATTAITPPLSQHDYPLPFVQPSSYLRPRIPGSRTMSEKQPLSPLDRDQLQGVKAIREFLRLRTSYDVLPMSFRLIVLDTDLLIKKSLAIFIQNTIVSAPLWDSHNSSFAGLLTSTDFINVIQYYCQYPDEISKLDQFRLSSLRDIEKAIGTIPLETVSVRPTRPLYEACRRMLKTRARRIPLVDIDDETGRETVVSVITQYRILKFIAVNNEHHTLLLKKPVRQLGIGTYANIATATMRNTVLDVVHLMVKHNISCVPIVDRAGRVLNVFEAVDIIPCIKSGAYDGLGDPVGEALCRRADDSPGILTCSEEDRLDTIFETIRKSKVHRFIVVDDEYRLKGIISLSDILRHVLLYGEEGETSATAS